LIDDTKSDPPTTTPEEITMTTRSSRIAFVFAAFTVIAAAAPMSAALADGAMSPNAITNSTSDMSGTVVPSTGIYDAADQYRDAKGFPQGGWQYLSFPPS
jgi:hypothetical protein